MKLFQSDTRTVGCVEVALQRAIFARLKKLLSFPIGFVVGVVGPREGERG